MPLFVIICLIIVGASLAVLLLVKIGVYGIFGPYITRHQISIPRHVDIKKCQFAEFEPRQRLFLSRTKSILEREGFTLLGYFTQQQDSSLYYAMYRSPDLRDGAMTAYIQHSPVRISYTEFYTEFESGKNLIQMISPHIVILYRRIQIPGYSHSRQ